MMAGEKFFWIWFVSLGMSYVAMAQSPQLSADSCHCPKALAATRKLVEENYAGFRDKVTPAKRADYDAAKAQAQLSADTATTLGGCRQVIKRYLRYFCDGHLYTIVDPFGTRADTSRRDTGLMAVLVEPSRDALTMAYLSDSVGILKIVSFDPAHIPEVERMIATHGRRWERLRLLVIDVRGNGGGSDLCYAGLRPYVLTGPAEVIGVAQFSTAENIKKYDLYTRSIPNISWRLRREFRRSKRIEGRRLGQYTPQGSSVYTIRVRLAKGPKRVAILIDTGCASTTEQLLLEVRQSAKVRIYGTHTAGILDYANVTIGPINHCDPLYLAWPTSRSLRVDRGQGIDNVGIAPDVLLCGPEETWLEQVLTAEIVKK